MKCKLKFVLTGISAISIERDSAVYVNGSFGKTMLFGRRMLRNSRSSEPTNNTYFEFEKLSASRPSPVSGSKAIGSELRRCAAKHKFLIAESAYKFRTALKHPATDIPSGIEGVNGLTRIRLASLF